MTAMVVRTHGGLPWVDPALDAVSGRQSLDAVPGRDLAPRSLLCCDPSAGLEVKSLRCADERERRMQKHGKKRWMPLLLYAETVMMIMMMMMSIGGVSHYDMTHFPGTHPVVTKQAIRLGQYVCRSAA